VAQQPGDQDEVLEAGEVLVDRGELSGQAHQAAHRIGFAHNIVAEYSSRA
jgi:hypothetical protein